MNTDIKDFFILSEKFSSSTLQVHPVELNFSEDENRLDDILMLLMGNYSRIKFPVVFRQEYGRKLEDMIRTGHAVLYLISEKMKTVLEENSLTGWKTFDVRILDKQGQEVIGYYGLSITGRCGPIDYSKCEIIEKRLVPNGPLSKYYKGLPIGLDKWDGSDFFLPERNFGTVVTSKAAEVLKKNKLTNIRLENLAEIETPDFALQKE